MREFKISCPKCGGHIAFGPEWIGQQLACPHCSAMIVLHNPARKLVSSIVLVLAIVMAAVVFFLLPARQSKRVQSPKPLPNKQFLNGAAASRPHPPAEVLNIQPIAETLHSEDPIEALRTKAEKGDAVAQFLLGRSYWAGNGVPKDSIEAARWFRKAADQGNADAQFYLGGCYYKGDGVAKDAGEAVKWYRKASSQGYAKAQLCLGLCYDLGDGVAEDAGEAVKWLRKAANQGNADAQVCLGSCYSQGDGVAKDADEAVKWYRKAANQGNAMAQVCLGGCYYQGDGVTKDAGEAAKWYRKAANQGNADAQFHLGDCYYQGDGVVKDDVEAYKWFNLSAAQGYKDAQKARGEIETRMTREQIAEGQRLAREFTPHKMSAPEEDTSRLGIIASRPKSSGTGFFISEDGYLVTNLHVVKEASQVRLVTAGGLPAAKVVKEDVASDLAVLKAKGRFSPLPISPSRGVKLGATAATVGFPNIGLQGFAPKLAKGEIASITGAQDDPRHFQISVPIQPGNSGGALVDERGNVIGVVVGKLSQQAALATSGQLAENVNYAVKSSFLLSFLESLPEVAAKLKEPNLRERKFEDVVKQVEQATVLVLVY